jgi:hypothetical protein
VIELRTLVCLAWLGQKLSLLYCNSLLCGLISKISVALYSSYSALEGKAASIVSLTPAVLLCSYAHACMWPPVPSLTIHTFCILASLWQALSSSVRQLAASTSQRQGKEYYTCRLKEKMSRYLPKTKIPNLAFGRVSCLWSSSDLYSVHTFQSSKTSQPLKPEVKERTSGFLFPLFFIASSLLSSTL